MNHIGTLCIILRYHTGIQTIVFRLEIRQRPNDVLQAAAIDLEFLLVKRNLLITYISNNSYWSECGSGFQFMSFELPSLFSFLSFPFLSFSL